MDKNLFIYRKYLHIIYYARSRNYYVTHKSYLHFIAWPAVRIFDLVLGPFTHSRRPSSVGGT